MDFVKNLAGGSSEEKKAETQQSSSSGGGFMDKLNGMAGGGKESEKNEDMLDKGVDFVQEKFLGAGDQSNESAMEQAKDEQISDFIRSKYKSTTGSDFPIADKDKKYGS
ncbi:Dead deah box helicase protein [Neofusicoccum parvum]|uniref:Dead deah box helicase protein n=2 Tax=Neofusicoccum parvum TaxID=310453 RepID=A0ACB5SQI5_9PEZI|nr:Dead deah box helicase protein [Neofusicoccum parvum]GME66491.1 Dead deah box helicase protein [Neofusicoccum parvum]